MVGLELALIAAALALLAFSPGRDRPGRRGERAALALLVVLAGGAYFGASRPGAFLHRWDLFHTLLGAKYFEELGYDGLYACALWADGRAEGRYADVRAVRDLKTLRYVPAERAVADADCAARFSPERLAEFTADLGRFGDLLPKERWSELFRDKGYNGSPFYTFVVRLAATRVPFEPPVLLALALVDPLLVLGSFAVAARAWGGRAAGFGFVVFCTCFPNAFAHMGGSFLRFDYFAWLLVGFAALRRGREGAAGACLATASAIRIFPAAFALAAGAGLALEAWRDRSRRAALGRYAAGLAAASTLAFLLSISFARGPANWVEFAGNLRVHTQRSAGYRIGLAHLFTHHGETDADDPFVPYETKAEELRRRPLPWLAAGALFVAAALALLPRLDGAGGPILAATVAVFAFAQATRYYWSILALLAFVGGGGAARGRWRAAVAGLLAISGVAWAASAWNDFAPFLYNYLFSFLLLGLLASMLAVLHLRRGGGRGAGGAAWAAAVATAAGVVAALAIWGDGDDGRRPRRPGGDPPRPFAAACCPPERRLRAEDLPAVAAIVSDLWSGRPRDAAAPAPLRLAEPAQAVYVAARSRGRRLAQGWETRGTTLEALAELLPRLRARAERRGEADVLEIDLTHSYRAVPAAEVSRWSRAADDERRGILGLEIAWRGALERHPPTRAIATNRSHRRLWERFAERQGLGPGPPPADLRTELFEAEQLLVRLGERPEAVRLERGNVRVRPEEVTRERVRAAADLAVGWLASNLDPDGRLAYGWLPSRGRPSSGENTVRQWMATIALGRAAAASGDPSLREKAVRNVESNLERFYVEEGGLGLVVEPGDGDVKLGAAALAAIALSEAPDAERHAAAVAALRRTVDSLWNPDGSFRTFLRPAGRNDNQNFYPGEALLEWSRRLRRAPDPELLERFRKSFAFYREWHLDPANRNPAFVPWHTMAYRNVWLETRDPALRDFVFETNDWLLDVQQWGGELPPDLWGRFFDPARPFGPPHASSTGVYLEGLAAAFAMARDAGDGERAERYRRAVLRGLRDVLQLQLADDVDLFYVSDATRARVRGGIRTEVYDNRIRCDNVQHNLMAMLDVLEAFGPRDWQPAERR